MINIRVELNEKIKGRAYSLKMNKIDKILVRFINRAPLRAFPLRKRTGP